MFDKRLAFISTQMKATMYYVLYLYIVLIFNSTAHTVTHHHTAIYATPHHPTLTHDNKPIRTQGTKQQQATLKQEGHMDI